VAFKQLRETGVDAVLCLVGDGPDRPQLEQRAHELGVIRDTLFLGYQEDVAPFYAAFDALILPSSNEGTPVSAIEALAAGRPVVATRVGGVPDVVQDGEDGFLVEPGATDDLAERLARLAHEPELRERMGRAGRDRVVPRYAVERLVDDVDRLYRSLLASSEADGRRR
jgi:glycosyltransferase involved in cell wall biosynthesis